MARYFYSYPYIKYKTYKTSGNRELRAVAGNLPLAEQKSVPKARNLSA